MCFQLLYFQPVSASFKSSSNIVGDLLVLLAWNVGELAFIELVGDFCGFESTSFVLISCLVANRCVVGVIGISVVNVLALKKDYFVKKFYSNQQAF